MSLATNAPPFRVVILSPPGYRHAAAFVEVAEALCHGIRASNLCASCGYNEFIPGARHIILGANLATPDFATLVPPESIIFNLEQLSEDSPWWRDGLRALLERFEVWDYSARNVATIRRLTSNDRVYHVPLGWIPQWGRINNLAPDDQNIDVLFYGSINPRRQLVLDQLRRRDLCVVTLFGVYGETRDAAIARAKVVLNMHLYPARILEVVRLHYLFANRKAVVAECNPGTELYPGIEVAAELVPYDDLADACVALVADGTRRDSLAKAGQEWAAARKFSDLLAPQLRRLVDSAAGTPSADRLPVPRHLALAPLPTTSGGTVLTAHQQMGADIVWPVHHSRPVGRCFDTRRFGQVVLREGSFDQIDLGDLPVYAEDWMSLLKDCTELLAPSGRLSMNVPHDLGIDAWRHPATRRGFNEKSFEVLELAHVTLGWPGISLDLAGLELHLSALGVRLQSQGVDRETLLANARAVNRMVVTLEKKTWGALPVSDETE